MAKILPIWGKALINQPINGPYPSTKRYFETHSQISRNPVGVCTVGWHGKYELRIKSIQVILCSWGLKIFWFTINTVHKIEVSQQVVLVGGLIPNWCKILEHFTLTSNKIHREMYYCRYRTWIYLLMLQTNLLINVLLSHKITQPLKH